MTITRDNYEPFFLDYMEGKLKENMIDEFLDFLKQNPDLKEELHLFENIYLPKEQVVYSSKEHLYKSTAEQKNAFEIKTIAFMEGDLKNEQRQSFKAYLGSHPELKKEYDLMAKTRLVADRSIIYPQKKNLYRKSGAILWLNWASRVAAVVVILWGINSLLQPGSQIPLLTTTRQMALVKTEPVTPAKKAEPTIKTPETERSEELANHPKPLPPNNSRHINVNTGTPPAAITTNSTVQEHDLTIPEKINPIMASLKTEPMETPLAVSHSVNREKVKNTRNVMTLDKFLLSRAKRVRGEGLLSANKIIRTGLNVASELSGERLGYKVKNGKIASLDFESKLMAFSIPLQKK